MADFTSELTEKHQAFIQKQHMFFVATSPKDGGRINLSPKGLNTFRIANDKQVAYLDLTGSGNETSAHLHENGRITIMFCAFEAAPLILRIYGRGRVIQPVDVTWTQWSTKFDMLPGARQIIAVDVESVQTSCGYAVPEYMYCGERQVLLNWAEKKGEDGLEAYRREKNAESIDGLPSGYRPAAITSKKRGKKEWPGISTKKFGMPTWWRSRKARTPSCTSIGTTCTKSHRPRPSRACA